MISQTVCDKKEENWAWLLQNIFRWGRVNPQKNPSLPFTGICGSRTQDRRSFGGLPRVCLMGPHRLDPGLPKCSGWTADREGMLAGHTGFSSVVVLVVGFTHYSVGNCMSMFKGSVLLFWGGQHLAISTVKAVFLKGYMRRSSCLRPFHSSNTLIWSPDYWPLLPAWTTDSQTWSSPATALGLFQVWI